MTPEEALPAARAAAQPYEEGPVSLVAAPAERMSPDRLAEWSLIDPSLERVYSTRRLGAPLTVAKRGLIRALRQYLGELIAQQSRYNAIATAHILHLEERVRRLEAELARRPR